MKEQAFTLLGGVLLVLMVSRLANAPGGAIPAAPAMSTGSAVYTTSSVWVG